MEKYEKGLIFSIPYREIKARLGVRNFFFVIFRYVCSNLRLRKARTAIILEANAC